MKIQINDFTQSIFETTLPIDNKLYNKVKKQKLTRYKHLKSNYDNSINKKLFDEIKNYLQEYVNYVGRILKREKNIIEYMWFQNTLLVIITTFIVILLVKIIILLFFM